MFLHQSQIYNSWYHHFIIKGDVSVYVNHTFFLHHNILSLVEKKNPIETKWKKNKKPPNKPQNQITNKPASGI